MVGELICSLLGWLETTVSFLVIVVEILLRSVLMRVYWADVLHVMIVFCLEMRLRILFVLLRQAEPRVLTFSRPWRVQIIDHAMKPAVSLTLMSSTDLLMKDGHC